MSLINTSIAAIMPYFPKWMVKPFANPYVAGENIVEVTKIIKSLNQQGYKSTVDILGEFVEDEKQASEVLKSYSELVETIAKEQMDSTISVKLTHLGLGIKSKIAQKNFSKLIEVGKKNRVGITIDMENSPYTSEILRIYKESLEIFDGVGTVIQAYLFRSLNDLKALDSNKLNLRICKGIYKEPKDISFQSKIDINKNFLELSKYLLKGKGYACLATHDLELINNIEDFVQLNKIDKTKFEFQALHGVPIKEKLNELKNKGYNVRIYVPYGPEWFEYSIRRIKENPKIVSYILKNMFKL